MTSIRLLSQAAPACVVDEGSHSGCRLVSDAAELRRRLDLLTEELRRRVVREERATGLLALTKREADLKVWWYWRTCLVHAEGLVLTVAARVQVAEVRLHANAALKTFRKELAEAQGAAAQLGEEVRKGMSAIDHRQARACSW